MPEARRNLARTANAAAKRLASMPSAAMTKGAMKTASGRCGSGLETASNGFANEPGRRNESSRKTAKDVIAAKAIGRHRGEGSRPSGKTNAIAVDAAKSVGQPDWSKSTAHSAPGSDPGRSSNPYAA